VYACKVTEEDIARWDAEDKKERELKSIHGDDSQTLSVDTKEHIKPIPEPQIVHKESAVIDKTTIDLIDFSKMLQPSCSPTSRKRKFHKTLNKSHCNRVILG